MATGASRMYVLSAGRGQSAEQRLTRGEEERAARAGAAAVCGAEFVGDEVKQKSKGKIEEKVPTCCRRREIKGLFLC